MVYIIAEVGPNHNGNLELALNYIEILSKIGVDAVKFQLGTPTDFISIHAFKADYQKDRDTAENPLEMSKKNQLTREDHRILKEHCNKHGVDYLCSGFDLDSVIFLNEELNISKFKVASGEIMSIDILEYISNCHKPVILSTGMSTYNEIQIPLDILGSKFNKDITLLHCISKYPAPYEDVNLRVMGELASRFKHPVGFSDHTIGNESAIAAVALGATIIEKHVTFDKGWMGADHAASSTIEEFEQLVDSIRKVEKILGTKEKRLSAGELHVRDVARKSIVAKTHLIKGHTLTQEDLAYKRPGIGILPVERDLILGKKLKCDVDADSILKLSQFENP